MPSLAHMFGFASEEVARKKRMVRRAALELCFFSGEFKTEADVDANPNHPTVRAAWERAEAEYR